MTITLRTCHFRSTVCNKPAQVAILALSLSTQLLSVCVAASTCGDSVIYLTAQQHVLNITSPNYPNAYEPGTNCRYRILAPYAHNVELKCRFEVYPNSCATEYFYISRDFSFRGGESFCANSLIERSSYFRSMSIGYYSGASAFTNPQQGRFFCQAYARAQGCHCGWTTPTRITNGQEATQHEFPSLVALRELRAEQEQHVFCGGSIVSNRHIMTAAHCMLVQPDPRQIIAYLGEHDLSSASESMFAVQHRIQQIIKHPDYDANERNVLNDLALLVTTERMEWSRGVGPICLPLLQASETFNFRTVAVAGWGATSFAGPKSNTLQKVELMTIENAACATQFNNSIAPTQICTYDYRGLGQDSCQFDSGGPLILKQQLQPAAPARLYAMGVISFGEFCGAPYGVGVNTRVTAYLNWLWSYLQSAGGVCVA